jgi:class 3 adenylate cyclase
MAQERAQRRLAAILAADVVGYSRLVERDEAGTVARLKKLLVELIQPMIARDGGRVVKLMGDGVLVEFGSAVDAVRNGLAIQAEVTRRNADVAEEDRIAFRIGINLGDVIIADADILAKVSRGLGAPMTGIAMDEINQRYAERGW